MTLNPIDHAAEAERLLAEAQEFLNDVDNGFLDDAVDRAGLRYDKAMVHASLAQVDVLTEIREHLAAIVKTDQAIDTANVIHIKESSADQFHAAIIEQQRRQATRRQS